MRHTRAVAAFLTMLAVARAVSASTHNQTLNTIRHFYGELMVSALNGSAF